ncbi:MAG TPA: caspase family protein [Polyangiaceae bacterium]
MTSGGAGVAGGFVRRLCRRLVVCALALLPLVAANEARGETRLHAVVIGNNRAFAGNAAGSESAPLRFADDDAAAFFEFIDDAAKSGELLTVMDDETQRLYPRLASRARAPTLAALKSAVARVAAHVESDRAGGHRSVVTVFFSGHGAVDEGGTPALALFDAGLTQDLLYRELLEKLPADEVHLLIDACHAEAVVRPRDAEVVRVSPGQANRFLVQSTLSRFPHVGAILAATTNAKAHEWDAIGHGVFTHELLSALRGAADVNRDRRVEYSEVYAFMASANRRVDDVRAQLAIVAKPPEGNRRAVLVELSSFPSARFAWLARVPGRHGVVEIGDARGRRIATLHTDQEFAADVLLPAGGTLYVRAGEREARFKPSGGDVVTYERLSFARRSSRERGALDDALRRGLFAAPYGRRYYDGVVDQTPALAPVEFVDSTGAPASYFRDEQGAGTRLVLGGGLSTGVAENIPLLTGLSAGLRPWRASGPALSLDVLTGNDGPIREWRVQAGGGFLWSLGGGPVRGWGGALGSIGWLHQSVSAQPGLDSGSLSLGPVVGMSTDVADSLGVWSELSLAAMLHQRDDDAAVSAVPSAWFGASLRL